MTELGVDALTLVAVALVLRGRPVVVLAVLLGVAVLVPTPLPVPHTHFSYVTVQHTVALAAAGRLIELVALRRERVRDLAAGSPILAAFAALLATSFVVGVVFSVGGSYSIGMLARMFDLATMVVFVVTCVVMMRRLPTPWPALYVAAGVLLVSVGIAIVERATFGSWGHWLFGLLPDPTNTPAAYGLDSRQGQPRVRAGGEFALQFAWVAAMLLPALVVVAARTRAGRFAAAAAAAVVLLGIYWSFSRSALAFAALVLVVLAVLSRDGRIVSVLLLGVAAAGVVYELHPVVVDHLAVSTDAGSVSIRFLRLHQVLAVLATHPLRGLGLANLPAAGLRTTDNALLLSYAELGAFGVIVLLVFFVVTVWFGVRTAFVARADERMVAIAAALGIVTFVVSAQVYDAMTLLQGPQVLCYLLALSVVVAERAGVPLRLPRPSSSLVLGVAAVGVAVSGVLLVVAPTVATRTFTVTALPPSRDAATYDTSGAGKLLLLTACAELDVLAERRPSVRVQCSPIPNASGVGIWRIEAPTPHRALAMAVAAGHRIHGRGGIGKLSLFARGGATTYRDPSFVAVALMVPVGAVLLLLLVPWRPARRRPSVVRHSSDVVVAFA